MGKGSRIRQKRQTAIGSIDRDQRRALQKIIDEEVNKALLEMDRRYWQDIVVMVLYVLHVACGFGVKRLHDYFVEFNRIHRQLRERYEVQEETTAWVCRQKIKELGIDLSKWEKEEDAA